LKKISVSIVEFWLEAKRSETEAKTGSDIAKKVFFALFFKEATIFF
jgi:hypothetical protein